MSFLRQAQFAASDLGKIVLMFFGAERCVAES